MLVGIALTLTVKLCTMGGGLRKLVSKTLTKEGRVMAKKPAPKGPKK